MSTWQRQYQYRGRHIFPRIFVGCVLTALALGFLLFLPPVGILLILLAVGVPIAIAQLGQDITIVAGPEGFSVTIEGKKVGRKHEQYAWSEITGTDYEEFTMRQKDGPNSVTRYFTVETSRGQAFRVQQNISQFDDLINVFNHQTPHLPYYWQQQAGFQASVGVLRVGKSAYVKAPRG